MTTATRERVAASRRTERTRYRSRAPAKRRLVYHQGGTTRMDTVPAKLTPRLVEEMDELVREGWYANRSELIRDAVREAIRRARSQRLERAIKEDVEWGLGARR